MKYIIVTQTYPPRIGGMQNVMTSISKRLSSIEDTHVFPDHFLSKKNGYIKSKLHIHNNFSPKIFRPFIKNYLVNKIYKDNDVVICDSWKSIKAVPSKVKKYLSWPTDKSFYPLEKSLGK